MPIKIVTIVGARPQFVKAAVVSQALYRSPMVSETLVHTGQHYDHNMSEVFFEQMGIPRPDIHLNIGSGSHGMQTGRMLEAIEQVLLGVKPDWVLLYGDTNSTLAGALAAAKLHLRVAHVEAGVRSFNRRMPEEINRVLCDQVSRLLLAPTPTAVDNLLREGVEADCIHVVGDVMYDAAIHYGKIADRTSDVLQRLDIRPGAFVLATVHRAENVDDAGRLRAILHGIGQLADDGDVVFPVHPRTRNSPIAAELLDELPPRVKCIEPVGYLEMLALEKHARLIVTDSGGVQKEAFFARVPCLTLRDETEWTELVDLGWNRLVTADELTQLRDVADDWLKSARRREPDNGLFGEGRASQRICDLLAATHVRSSEEANHLRHCA